MATVAMRCVALLGAALLTAPLDLSAQVVYCTAPGVPVGCVARVAPGAGAPGVGVLPGAGAGAPGVGVAPGAGVGAPGAGVAPEAGEGVNRGGPVNRPGRR